LNPKIITWVEQYLFFPTPFQQLLSVILFPLTIVYCIVVALKRLTAKPQYYGIPVVSIGNLLVGGTGKTPLTIELAKKYPKSAVVLRGYGRKTKELIVVSQNGNINSKVEECGDEAMVLATSLLNSTVIVSIDRVEGILKAKELGCEVVFLDDGFSKYDIFKLDFLIRPKNEPTNLFCLPSGGYRDTKMLYSFADLVLKEEADFTRRVTLKQNNEEIKLDSSKLYVVVTAISKPQRLLEFLDSNNIKLHNFADHYNFTQHDIDVIKETYKGYEIITTLKDFVKLDKFNLENLILMDLSIELLTNKAYEKIDTFIEQSKTV
jgi:tetraacyldisaccharide 4'-kinase